MVRRVFRKCGIDLEQDCWTTHALICHPGMAPADDKRVDYCSPNIKKLIKELKPRTIITFGYMGTSTVIRWAWGANSEGVERWVGCCIPSRALNAWICPTYSPAYVAKESHGVLNQYFEESIEAALELQGCPWPDGAPDYSKDVRRVFDTDEAASILTKMAEAGGPISFDYETTCLKAENEHAAIVSAAVCWRGRRTIAYPWHGAAIAATSALLRTSAPKVAANLMFEDRWTRRHLGHPVRGWYWDTMQAAHVIDNRPGITSVGFQSFALLGTPDYEDHIKPYLRSEGDTPYNNIHRVDMADLLLYNGLDALHEYKIAEKQMLAIGYPLPENF